MTFPEMALLGFGLISLFAVGITIYDKIASKYLPRHRISEAFLLSIGAIYGAPAMYLTMQLIRHKTRKPKFMVTLPIFIVLQVALVILIWKGVL